jgi:hypothetical protein
MLLGNPDFQLHYLLNRNKAKLSFRHKLPVSYILYIFP